jgi:hypothetical protein
VHEPSTGASGQGAGSDGAEQDGGANVAREMERAMRQCDETARTECRFQL